ncbi:MAG: CAP domain-containing protein [Parcubacteria group bacterium]
MNNWFRRHFLPHYDNNHHPHLLRYRSLLAAMAVVALLQSVIIFGSFVLPRLHRELAAVLPAVVTFLTNNARAERQLAEVKVDSVLTKAAQAKALDMAAKGYFSHVSPDGTEPWYWLEQAGYEYQYAGENLAVNFSDSEELVKAWQNSPTHNMNLLGPRYTETGVGVAVGTYEGREAVFVVQFFASPAPYQLTTNNQQPPPIQTPSASLDSSTGQEPEVLSSEVEVVPAPSVLSRIVSAPRTYTQLALMVLASLFAVVLLLGLGRHHPRAVAGGAIMVGMLVGLIYVNKFLPPTVLEIPADARYAITAAFSAGGE